MTAPAWWRLACDTCQLLGPVVADREDLLAGDLDTDEDFPVGAATFADGALLLRDGRGDLWPLWEDFAGAHHRHALVLVDAAQTGAAQVRPGWTPRVLHGPVPYQLDDYGRRVPGPGPTAQLVACPACGYPETQWYASPKHGPFILCRRTECRLPSGPGAERHIALADLRQEIPMMEDLTKNAHAIEGSGTYGR